MDCLQLSVGYSMPTGRPLNYTRARSRAAMGRVVRGLALVAQACLKAVAASRRTAAPKHLPKRDLRSY